MINKKNIDIENKLIENYNKENFNTIIDIISKDIDFINYIQLDNNSSTDSIKI